MSDSRVCEECGRPSADYGEYLKGAYGPKPVRGVGFVEYFPPKGYCGRANQAEDYYDNGQCEDCATYPLLKRIEELEAQLREHGV